MLKRHSFGPARIEPAMFRSAWISDGISSFRWARVPLRVAAMWLISSRCSQKAPPTAAWTSWVGMLVMSCALGAAGKPSELLPEPLQSGVNTGSPHRQPAPVSAVSSPPEFDARGPMSEALPFRLQLFSASGPLPVIEEFSVRFSLPCVTVERVSPSGEHRYVARVEGRGPPRGHRLRARYDGHTSRPLTESKRMPSAVDLLELTDEWTGISPGVHEVVVFATDVEGVVPQTHDGGLAFTGCRFLINSSGNVEELPPPRHPAYVLLSPEGTLHGPDAGETLLQIGVSRRTPGPFERDARSLDRHDDVVQLVIVRPDEGKEVHAIQSGSFVMAPLEAGDYVLSLERVPESATSPLTTDALGYEHRITVNPE